MDGCISSGSMGLIVAISEKAAGMLSLNPGDLVGLSASCSSSAVSRGDLGGSWAGISVAVMLLD